MSGPWTCVRSNIGKPRSRMCLGVVRYFGVFGFKKSETESSTEH